jgi:hypothetical protein
MFSRMPAAEEEDLSADDRRASEILAELRDVAASGGADRIPLGELFRGTGHRVHGLAILIFALPEAIPFPAVGLTGLVAIPIAALSVSLIAHGERGDLPAWILRRRIRADLVRKVVERGLALVTRLERVSHPRRVEWLRHVRLLGVLCLALSVVASIPLPFTNVAPGVTLVAIGLGLFQGDGVLVALASMAGLLICAIFAGSIVLAGLLLL